MDNTLSAFENLIRRVIIPMYPSISDVLVRKILAFPSVGEMSMVVQIIYKINERIDYSLSYKIEGETREIYRMMGFKDIHIGPKVNFVFEDHWDSKVQNLK